MKKISAVIIAIVAISSGLFYLQAADNTPKSSNTACCAMMNMPVMGEATPLAEGVKPYPLTTCIVSDEKLGEMGKPVSFVHEGQEIKLCCKACRKDFDKEPATYLKKITNAEKK